MAVNAVVQLVVVPAILIGALVLTGLVPARMHRAPGRRATRAAFWTGLMLFVALVYAATAVGVGSSLPTIAVQEITYDGDRWQLVAIPLLAGVVTGIVIPASIALCAPATAAPGEDRRLGQWIGSVVAVVAVVATTAGAACALWAYYYLPEHRYLLVPIALGSAVGFLVFRCYPTSRRDPLGKPTIMGW